MENIIQQLKDNEKPFGLMSEEMQEKAREIGRDTFQVFGGSAWSRGGRIYWVSGDTYRLRPDYEEEPEIRQMGISPNNSNCLCMYNDEGQSFGSIANVHERPDFIGFKFEDGAVFGIPIQYHPSRVMHITDGNDFSALKVLHATHVLFRSNKL